ncbi:MAG TPA: muconolactone Delta-isomerase family protein [Nitrososphaera sp.]|nr:muconolactone Delta-isomerase family protein [Nitrososphaera sp.]
MILDVASNEELQQTLFLLPSMPLVKRTVRPLTEIKSVEDLVVELESIVSSMPRKPGEKKRALLDVVVEHELPLL